MHRVTKNTYTECYYWGCNPSFVATSDGVVLIDTPQQPIDAMRWKDIMQAHGPLRYLVNTEPHGDHIMGNAYYPEAEVIGHDTMLPRYEAQIPAMTSDARRENMEKNDPDSVFLLNHPDFPPHPPTRLFEKELSLTLGDHTFNIFHLPGHTGPQTAIHVPEEHVVFTGDNVFFRCKTWLQEADPYAWLAALETLDAMDVEKIVPGHGEVCDKSYLARQREVIQGWLDLVEGYIAKGMTEEEAVAEPVDVHKIDPYPIGQRMFPFSERLNGMNVRNLFRHVANRE